MLIPVNKINSLRGLKRDLNILYSRYLKIKRRKKIRDYFIRNEIYKLHLGSNRTILKGWLCSDIVPQNNQSIFLDVRERFPFVDNVIDYIYAEHLIEHLCLEEGIFMLNECFRILKKNGRLRLATPDLDVVLRLYTERNKKFGTNYIKWSIDNFSKTSHYDPVIVVNTLFHNWGHQFLYDFDYLKDTLKKCGFVDIERFFVSHSKNTHLQNIERHQENVGNFEMTDFETLIIEATKK